MSKLSLTRLAVLLYSVDALLVAAFVAGMFGMVTNPIARQLFDLDAESSFPAWFSSSQLLAAGIVFLARSFIDPNGSIGRIFFLLWAMAFLFLSADEAIGLHEKITLVFRDVEFLPRFSGNHGIWIPLYALAGSIFIAGTAKSSLRLWRSGNTGIVIMFIGIAIFVCGAVLVEIVSYGNLREIVNHRNYLIQVVVEESLELVGISTILVGAIKACFGETSPAVAALLASQAEPDDAGHHVTVVNRATHNQHRPGEAGREDTGP